MELQFSFRSADDLKTGMQQEKEQKRHKTDNRKTRIEGGKKMKREEDEGGKKNTRSLDDLLNVPMFQGVAAGKR